jgi:UPF0271 protein
MHIDINCDMGESYGRFVVGNDQEILPFITSANIACGFHAGDPLVMRQTIKSAKSLGVAVGAHPGFPDLVGFGRREMKISAEQLFCDLVYQIGALKAFAELEGITIQHVKPHGALYNLAHRDRETAQAIAAAVYAVDPGLALFTLPAGELRQAAEQRGLRAIAEFFADRTYQDDGSLTPRHHKDALIHDPAIAAQRVVRMLTEKKVKTVSGNDIAMEAETICIHGDETTAAAFAKEIRSQLEKAGVVVKAIGAR